MKAKDIPVTYVVFPDEGHGFARPENNIAFNAVAEKFLAKCLGGRAEPIGPSLKASTAEVRYGAEYAPGLAEAMRPHGQMGRGPGEAWWRGDRRRPADVTPPPPSVVPLPCFAWGGG